MQCNCNYRLMPATVTRLLTTTVFLVTVCNAILAETLPNSIVSTLNQHDLSPDGLSIFIRGLDGGSTILNHQADIPRNPASTMKLVTAIAALETLTPGYLWTTRLYADQEPVDGVLDGDIYLVGGGDPYLVHERLWLMLQSLKRSGVSKITGDLIVDDSLFAPIREDTGAFDNQPFRVYNAIPSAVLTNFNSSYFIFEPGPGTGVTIQAFPELSALSIDNRLKTTDKACRGYRRGISLSVKDTGTARFDGRFPSGCKQYSFTRSVLPPMTYTTSLFKRTWQDLGGELAGVAQYGSPNDEAILLLEHASVSLGDATRLMNKHSSNLIARHLLLTMGGENSGWPATETKGLAAIHDWLKQKNLAFPELIIENGAGRSRKARISARHLVEIVETGWTSPYMPEFVASMALLGQDGTLDDRHTRSRLNGRAHFKTGRLDHVTAIAGIMQNNDGKRYALAILHNDTDVHRGLGEAVQDTVLQWLDNYKKPTTP